jgi:hypothetical protein
MKTILFSTFLVLIAVNTRAQVFFNQNFSSGGVFSDYVDAAATTSTNKFTSISTAANVTPSINANKLRFSRIDAASTNAGSFNIFQTDNPLTPATIFTKISFEFTVSDNSIALAPFGFFLACETLGTNATPPSNDNNVHSSIAFNTTATNGEFSISDETPNAAGTTTSTTFTGAQTLTWFVNNSGASQTYTSPSASSETIADDTFDLWVGTTLVFEGIAATKPLLDLRTFKFALKNSQGQVTVDFDNLVLEDLLNTLPVNLTAFDLKKQDNGVLLNWRTASENNNDYFLLEKSVDGIAFETIKTVKSSGNSSTPSNYSYVDHSPKNGINYYRLSQIDLDGTKTELKVDAINFSISDKPDFTVYPNPAVSEVNIELHDKIYEKVELLNANGQIVLSSKITNTQAVKLDVSALAKGIYTVSLTGSKGVSASKIIVK